MERKTYICDPPRKPNPGAKYHVRPIGSMHTYCGRHVWDVDLLGFPKWFEEHSHPEAIADRICTACSMAWEKEELR